MLLFVVNCCNTITCNISACKDINFCRFVQIYNQKVMQFSIVPVFLPTTNEWCTAYRRTIR